MVSASIGMTVMLGVVLPPMAICVFVVKQITKTPFSVVYAGVYPFLISIIVGGIRLHLPRAFDLAPPLADAGLTKKD